MRVPFKTTYATGSENIMVVGDINPDEIRYNRDTKEIFLIIPEIEQKDVYDIEFLDALSWQKIKKLVLSNKGTWNNKAEGIEYLTGMGK